MGTLFRITVYAHDATSAGEAFRAAFERIADLDAALSDYKPDSELMRLCRDGHTAPVAVSADLFTVLTAAQQLAEETGGAFDVTLGPVIRLWRTARREKWLPAESDLKAAAARTGYRNVLLDPAKRTVFLKLADMQLDLGAIAKGYAADEALAVLRSHRITRALVAASGDLAIGDPPPGTTGWRVGVDSYRAEEGRFSRTLILRNAAISTSGDTEQFTEIGGVRYSHIIDPATLHGLTQRIGVTVIAARGLDADSLATALSVLGRERGLELIAKRRCAASLFVTDRGENESPSFLNAGTRAHWCGSAH